MGVFDQDLTTDSASDSHKESSLILKGAPVEQEASQLGPARRLFAGPFEKKGGKYIAPPKFYR